MPNYLTYTPSCEAYIETTVADGTKKYYDVSEDIAHMEIARIANESSSFNITLSNKNRKYNGLFSAMDRIVIYASKTERYRMLTGYITSVDVFTLYSGDFHISGKCSLYQLQNMFWDPGLDAVQKQLKGQLSSVDDSWMGPANLAYFMLQNVGGWQPHMIGIGAMPGQVMEWAQEMYLAQKGDIEQAEKVLEEFYEMMHTHSNQIASGWVDVEGGSNSAAKAARPVGGSHADGAKYHQTQGNGVCCGATSFTIALNMMLGLTGANAYQNLSVWSSSAFGSDSTVDIAGKGSRFLSDEGLSGKLSFSYYHGGDITQPSQLREELTKGNVVVISSGANSNFRNADGSGGRYYGGGHFIMFYNYSKNTYFANDPAVGAGQGAGIPYSEADIKQWLDGRSYHTAAVMSIR